MTYTLIVLVVLAALHFSYESIIAPSLRLRLRYRLFELRDRARNLKIQHGHSLRDRHFDYLQDSINGVISVLYQFDLAALVTIARELRSNAELRDLVATRAKALDDCPIPDARKIRYESCRIAAYAVAVNNGAWTLFVAPVAAAYIGFSAIKSLIRQATSLPERDIQRAIPSSSAGSLI
jgi:hypothetical protein